MPDHSPEQLAAQQDGLRRDVDSISKRVDTLHNDIADLRESQNTGFEKLHEALDRQRREQSKDVHDAKQVLFAEQKQGKEPLWRVAAMLLTVIGMLGSAAFGYLNYRDDESLTDIRENQAHQEAHEALPWHPQAAIEAARTQERLRADIANSKLRALYDEAKRQELYWQIKYEETLTK